MCYFDVIELSDVISSIGPKISDADTYNTETKTFKNLCWILYLPVNCLVCSKDDGLEFPTVERVTCSGWTKDDVYIGVTRVVDCVIGTGVEGSDSRDNVVVIAGPACVVAVVWESVVDSDVNVVITGLVVVVAVVCDWVVDVGVVIACVVVVTTDLGPAVQLQYKLMAKSGHLPLGFKTTHWTPLL